MTLKELLTGLEVLQIIGDTNIEVTGIQSDSRRVTSGNMFVAQVGTTVDGHVFIPQCIENGATTIVMDKARNTNLAFCFRSFKDFVGITKF